MTSLEQQLEALFTPGCDPYEAAARALFGAEHVTSQDTRDLIKHVFMCVSIRRSEAATCCTGTLVHDEFTPCPVHDRGSHR